jgi:uncharacterized membrane protein YfcA
MERNRTTLLYMMAGGAVGVILGIVLKALAETSGTPSSGDHPPDSLMFWIQPFISAGRTIARAVQGFFARSWQALVYFVLMHLKATILTIVGALVGLVLGIRAEKKRRARHARRLKTGPRKGARRDAES